ncbi:hypothetical protein [Halobacterium jilantaiense]|uniref:Uncharacterized protein n=1 Tax=Halobacterium jilantaiense TaxID=355548 RepID=A0A1I0MG65_9EURY|nr:hypothetical protein [Halobacterium jilantaiense]SEV87108.1 hypothetical protein SAMN04487945_0024 [Halobacterium jilantaiense]
MDRSRFTSLSLVAFGLVLVAFFTMGFSRLVLPYETARLLAAPAMFGAAALFAGLFAQALLVAVGVREFE